MDLPKYMSHCGTQGYIPLECYLFPKIPPNPKKDIWACGVIFLSLLNKKSRIFRADPIFGYDRLSSPTKCENFMLGFLLKISNLYDTNMLKIYLEKLGFEVEFPKSMPVREIDWKLLIRVKSTPNDPENPPQCAEIKGFVEDL
jgi:serine/threonine protein kinase